MIINIALGIVLGVLLLIVAGIIVVAIGTVVVHLQDRTTQQMQEVRVRHDRIRPEAENYKHMQELKRKAKASNPTHWKEEKE